LHARARVDAASHPTGERRRAFDAVARSAAFAFDARLSFIARHAHAVRMDTHASFANRGEDTGKLNTAIGNAGSAYALLAARAQVVAFVDLAVAVIIDSVARLFFGRYQLFTDDFPGGIALG
jgi:hypothetical protein